MAEYFLKSGSDNFQTIMTLKNKLLRIRNLLFQPDDKCVKAKNTEISVFLTFF